MKLAVLGTGMVGRAHAEKLAQLKHDVMIGTRDVKKSLGESKPDMMGNPPFGEWKKSHANIRLGTFSEAAKHGEIVINALKGEASVSTLQSLKSELRGKTILDISNPLDFSKGMPPSLFVCNTDSLAEQIQRAVPQSHVVKTLNTMNAFLQVNPNMLENGNHTAFVSGNDSNAKTKVTQMLKEWYGWKDVIDLGDISTARAAEMLLPLWVRLWSSTQNANFNIKVVQEKKL